MKRLCSFLIITVLFAGTAFAQARFDQQNESAKQRENKPAQNRDNRQRGSKPVEKRDNRQRELESVTVEGTLQLEKGFIALASGDTVYYVPMLQRYAGFIDGIKEGAKVSVEGYQFRNMLHPKKITVNGKNYDFPEYSPNRNNSGRNDFRKDGHHRHGRNNFEKGHGHRHGRGGHKHHKQQGRGKGRSRGGCCW